MDIYLNHPTWSSIEKENQERTHLYGAQASVDKQEKGQDKDYETFKILSSLIVYESLFNKFPKALQFGKEKRIPIPS